ncbi:glyoxylase-like metal-dependent hydrolase (beta-lactamase superfamily II) [Ornithinimicrobium humiphilum]|uniref:Glyoxylase-like metal-dependent hydrolase (Beta-lactamase superfamily II) n=1 Tax=Ornithinimicrobium humiphilum TaxID=125288 RepID=A0A543KMQ0_9MICO|nr:MBL fold metallo-hydrolase [Ornithinimicrobium humiphilum]TQM96339.1 glyoxylase-like metal-dependent hydrolase (beta-lactamase superfamily II) [Ornithinimicrobium humiphilum]
MLTEVADGVLVHTSALLANNTIVVEGGSGMVEGPPGVLVVDAGVTEAELTCLATDVVLRGTQVVAGFSTHPDWDHVLWHGALGAVPRYGTEQCAERTLGIRAQPGWRAHVAAALPEEIADDVPLDLVGLLTGLPEGTQTIPWGGPTVRVVHHPAHSPGHAALVVEEARVLVAGDMLSDVLVPMLDDLTGPADPLKGYLAGLDVLEALLPEVDVVVPGHGTPCTAADARTRLELDRQHVLALRDGRPFDDPRAGAGAQPGWEWVADLAAGQAESVARWQAERGARTVEGVA